MTVIAVALFATGCSTRPARPALASAPTNSPPDATEVGDIPPSRTAQDALGGDRSVEIEAPSFVIMEALCRPEVARRVLPRVADIETLGREHGDAVWRVSHAFGLFRGGYVLRIRKDWADHGRHTIRFWVDTRYDRDVEDAWGYFHLEPLGPDRTRLHYRVRAVLLPGLVRWLFADKIQWALMTVPDRARAFFEDRREQACTTTSTPDDPSGRVCVSGSLRPANFCSARGFAALRLTTPRSNRYASLHGISLS